MGSELGVIVLLAVYILGALGYTGYLVLLAFFADPARSRTARKKLHIALFMGFSGAIWAALWWKFNFPAHLTPINVLVFAFLPAMAVGTIIAEIVFKIGALYEKLKASKG